LNNLAKMASLCISHFQFFETADRQFTPFFVTKYKWKRTAIFFFSTHTQATSISAQTSHLGQVVQFFFWRTTSRQTHQIRLVYTTDNFFKRLGPYITHSPVALPFHPIQEKWRESRHSVLPIKIHLNIRLTNIDVSLFSPLHLFAILGSSGINGRKL
jgi:hypothetical protein